MFIMMLGIMNALSYNALSVLGYEHIVIVGIYVSFRLLSRNNRFTL